MKIKRLELENIRNLENVSLNLNDSLVVFIGKNGSGKTNIIEAIYYLTIFKPLKKGRDNELIKKGLDLGKIKGLFETENDGEIEIETILSHKKINKLNKNPVKIKDIIGKTETVVFTVDDLNIIESPKQKRRFLNILLSLIDKKYLLNLIEYRQILQRRNKVLFLIKIGKSKINELNFWDEKLADFAVQIIKKRTEIIKNINNILKNNSLFFNECFLELIYKPTTQNKEKMISILKEKKDKDILLGQTTVGPHRDNIIFKLGEIDLEKHGSRGEKRVAVIELKKTEIELIKKEKKVNPTLILDDVFSELDNENSKRVLDIIKSQQTIITTTNLNLIKNLKNKAKVYNIEEGKIKNV